MNKAVKKIQSAKAIAKEWKTEKTIRDLTTMIGEYLFDEGFMCCDCPLHPNTCEGSKCGDRMSEFYEDKKRSEIGRVNFRALGHKFYNQSQKVKNELRK